MSYSHYLASIDDRLCSANRLLDGAQRAVDSGAFNAAATFVIEGKALLARFIEDKDGTVFGRPRAGMADAEFMLEELLEIDEGLRARNIIIGFTRDDVRRGRKEVAA